MNEAAWTVYLQIWFAQWWRMVLWMLLCFVGLTVVMFAITLATMALTGSREVAGLMIVLNVIGFVGGLVISFWAWKKSLIGILDKNYGGYRLQLVPAAGSSMTTDSGAK